MATPASTRVDLKVFATFSIRSFAENFVNTNSFCESFNSPAKSLARLGSAPTSNSIFFVDEINSRSRPKTLVSPSRVSVPLIYLPSEYEEWAEPAKTEL